MNAAARLARLWDSLAWPGRIGVVIVGFWLAMAAFGGWVAPYDAGAVVSQDVFGAFSARHPLGTDYLGRDMLSRILHGSGLFNFYASLALWGCGSVFLEDIFNSRNHDFIVASQSQKGGLPTTNTTTYNSQEHMGSVANPQVMTRVQYLLNQPPGAPVFADSYSGFALTYNVNVPCAPFTDHETNKRSNMTPSLEITSPSFNSSIPGGSTMNLTYTASEIDSVMCFIRVKNDTVLTISNSGAAGSLNIPIPSYLFGKKKVGFDWCKYPK